jgi:hypothetical protein
MANQSHDRGEPLKFDNAVLPSPAPFGEPRICRIGDQEVELSGDVVASLVASHHADADINGGKGICYFASAQNGQIKIGFTDHPKSRLKALRTAHGRGVEYLAHAYGGRIREAAYHFQFAPHRLHGEWFAPHPDILSEIERLNTPTMLGGA